jgi:uncharacterized membrane protein
MWTISGLIFDVVGFLLVFIFGGFEIGRSGLLLENDNSEKMKPLKILGSILVILGFVFQLVGAWIKG